MSTAKQLRTLADHLASLDSGSGEAAMLRSAADENDRLRAALLPCLGWLEYAYGNVSSITATAVKAHLPEIRSVIANSGDIS